jgi:hypothetical protein
LLANKCPTEVVAVVPSTVYRKVLSVSTVIWAAIAPSGILGKLAAVPFTVSDLYNVKSLIKRNKSLLDEKMDILNTRDVQLENTINKTIFNKKVLYIFICIIIALIVVILLVYSFTRK